MLPRYGLVASLVLAAIAVAAFAREGASASGHEHIQRYDVFLEVEADGDLHVEERIVYDFGSSARHGIFRDIPVRLRYDDRYDRRYPLSEIEVFGTPGTPVDLEVSDFGGGRTRLRIGDPDRTIEGVHTYTIRYRVEAALNGFEDHDELFWNAIGTDWDVTIDNASVHVVAPAEITGIACYAGPAGSQLSCDAASSEGAEARFSEPRLGFYGGLSVVIAFPKGVVPEPEPILVERWDLGRAFTVSPLTVGAASALAVVLFGALVRLLWVAGRDRRWAGSAVNAVFGHPSDEVDRVALFDGGPYPVEFTPPEGLRPGEIGTLVDEVAHPLDVSATIIDLAVRGHLRIEEVPPSGLLRWFGKTDWKLFKLVGPDDLREYEQLLLIGLFETGDEVLLSSLRTKFVEHLGAVQQALYDDVVKRGWFIRSPARTRQLWMIGGFLLLGLGIAVQAAAIAWTKIALVPLALPLAGLVVLFTHRRMPRRTPKGTGALMRVRGFQRFIETAEGDRASFAEESQLFYDYLPYAVVFGATERWAKAFEGLADTPEAHAWYAASSSTSTGRGGLVDALDSFTVTSSGTIASTPGGSGSSGFGGGSGGGGGGGGGGSW